MNWELVIGIEIHVQLATDSKLFSGASTQYGAEPNTQACAVDLAMPGTLPVLNHKVIELATKFGLSVDATINQHNVFARKNYFYPDLPKGYQISQFELPIVEHGHLDISLSDGSTKRVGITRAHLEEDAGKSVHEGLGDHTGVDLNRAGTPLLEIVSEPDMRSAEEAVTYCKTMHQLVRYLGISDGNMQEGSFRCDINISLRPVGQEAFGTRTELKNLNSFRFIEHAIYGEVARQQEILEDGGKIIQQTRLYDPDKDETRAMRSKEDAHDYRYFPDPDLLPVSISQHTIDEIKNSLPELPWQKAARYINDYAISKDDATIITNSLDNAHYFESAIAAKDDSVKAKQVANWFVTDVLTALEQQSINQSPVNPQALAELLLRIADNTISTSIAKKVFTAMWQGEGSADQIIEAQGLKQMSDSGELEAIVKQIITDNPEQAEQYRGGKDKLISFFVGQVMKATKGKANPGMVNQLLKKHL
ncbi:MAG: Asp-tRNA(Asn)/Glu-tRNA(Gln) amidotransferase subunit GatB [Coxiellaceae bacterium]|nr:Asp-tRNA(Asn)/Glu-tRNA(Gln) amidotransferase subunit GatB [Coxiellaceae bacterium]